MIREVIIKDIDLDLLKHQKASLVNLLLVASRQANNRVNLDDTTDEHLTGILHLLDHIQDQCEEIH